MTVRPLAQRRELIAGRDPIQIRESGLGSSDPLARPTGFAKSPPRAHAGDARDAPCCVVDLANALNPLSNWADELPSRANAVMSGAVVRVPRPRFRFSIIEGRRDDIGSWLADAGPTASNGPPAGSHAMGRCLPALTRTCGPVMRSHYELFDVAPDADAAVIRSSRGRRSE